MEMLQNYRDLFQGFNSSVQYFSCEEKKNIHFPVLFFNEIHGYLTYLLICMHRNSLLSLVDLGFLIFFVLYDVLCTQIKKTNIHFNLLQCYSQCVLLSLENCLVIAFEQDFLCQSAEYFPFFMDF